MINNGLLQGREIVVSNCYTMKPWDCFNTPVTFKPGDRARIQYQYNYPGGDNLSAYFSIRKLGNEGRKLELEGMYHSYHLLYDLIGSKAINRAPVPKNKPVIPYLLKNNRAWALYFSSTFRNLLALGRYVTHDDSIFNWPIRNWLFEGMYPEYVFLKTHRAGNRKVQNSGPSGRMMPSRPHFPKSSSPNWATKKLYYQSRTN